MISGKRIGQIEINMFDYNAVQIVWSFPENICKFRLFHLKMEKGVRCEEGDGLVLVMGDLLFSRQL